MVTWSIYREERQVAWLQHKEVGDINNCCLLIELFLSFSDSEKTGPSVFSFSSPSRLLAPNLHLPCTKQPTPLFWPPGGEPATQETRFCIIVSPWSILEQSLNSLFSYLHGGSMRPYVPPSERLSWEICECFKNVAQVSVDLSPSRQWCRISGIL